jgi:hypothetical protein
MSDRAVGGACAQLATTLPGKVNEAFTLAA